MSTFRTTEFLSWVILKMEETTTTIATILKQVREQVGCILKRRGNRRQLAIEELLDVLRQHYTRQGVIIEEFKLAALKLEGNLTEIKVNTIVDTKLKEKCAKLETEAERHDVWKARYQKHFAQQEAEIKELKKKLGIKEVPWYVQDQLDPAEP